MTQTGFRAGDFDVVGATQANGASYEVISQRFRFRTDIREFAERVDRLLGQFRLEASGELPTYSLIRRSSDVVPLALYLNDELLREGDALEPLLHHLMWHVNSEAVARTEDFLILHAAAASLDGRGVLLPGPEESGKTTLVAGLTQAGFSYLTDEAALLDPDTSLLHPYPRALWMDGRSLALLGLADQGAPSDGGEESAFEHHVLPEELRHDPVGESSPVRYVIVPSYRPEVETALIPLRRGAALVHLLDNAFNFGRFGSRGFRVAAGIVEQAECFRLEMSDLSAAVRLVSQLVGGNRDGHAAS
jgi:hypothetical protein